MLVRKRGYAFTPIKVRNHENRERGYDIDKWDRLLHGKRYVKKKAKEDAKFTKKWRKKHKKKR